jgi:drug/metabolite transporter (DMT)-like permease
MLAVLLALASAAGFGSSDYAGGLAARRASIIRITILAQGVNAALMFLILPLAGLRAPSPGSLAWGAAAGLSGAMGALALYAGFRSAAFSVAGPLSAIGAAGFSVLAGLLLGERPGGLALLGIGLALPAIIGVSASPGSARPGGAGSGGADSGGAGSGGADSGGAGSGGAGSAGADSGGAGSGGADSADSGRADSGQASRGEAAQASTGEAGQASGGEAGREVGGEPGRAGAGHPAAGVAWGLVAGAGFAVLFIALNRAGAGSGLWPVVASQITALAAVACLGAATGELRLPPRSASGLAALTGVTGAAGTVLYFYATHAGLLAVTAVLTSLYPAVTILLARVFLGERLTVARLAGLCLAAASVGLIAAAGAG